jgi:CubicO group peptidase (beta-lactamase class C family)
LKPKKSILILFLISTLFYSCDSCQQGGDSLENALEQYRQVLFDRSKSLEDFLSDVKNHYKIPAIAAALTTLDSIQMQAAVGVKNNHLPEKVTINDIFCIGSCAKSMTATLIAAMVEDGLLGWETRPIDVFPDLNDLIHPKFHDITIKQLLSHSAGIQPFVSDEDFFGVYDNIKELTGSTVDQRRKFTFWNLKRKPASTPGSYSYSNGGYVIAAAMAEKLSGESWEFLINKYVFEPLNLNSALIGMPQDKSISNVRRHYCRDSEGNAVPLPLDARKMAALFNPSGTVSLSITDFAKYALFHLRGLNGIDHHIKSKSIVYLHQPIVEINNQQSYALGWNIIKIDDFLLSTHSGGDSSVYAVIGIDRSKNIAGVVLCNMGDAKATAACANIMLEMMP